MKKRINSSEIERAKRSNMFLFILTILMLFVVIGGLVFYVLYDKELISFKTKDEVEEENIISKNETKFNVKMDNVEALRLYDIVRISNNKCDEYIKSDGFSMKKLSDECKYTIAANIYNKNIKSDNDKKYVLEEDVKYAYESLYGENTYRVQETIPYVDNYKLMYSAVNHNYFIQGEINETDSNIGVHEMVISIKKENN